MSNGLKDVTPEYIKECFAGNVACSQIVFSAGVDEDQFDPAVARQIAAAFGAGMWNGETCGAVTGGLMALGLKYGNGGIVDAETFSRFLAKKNEYEKRFIEENGSLICREITGLDPSVPEQMQKIINTQIWFTHCPGVVMSACRILADLLEEE